ncbi:MAG: hypothetical protein U0R49_01295 [Fimbriimonadales bacterium]
MNSIFVLAAGFVAAELSGALVPGPLIAARVEATARVRCIGELDGSCGPRVTVWPVRFVHAEYNGDATANGVWLPTKWKTRVDNGDFGAEQTCRYTLNGSLPVVFADARGVKDGRKK